MNDESLADDALVHTAAHARAVGFGVGAGVATLPLALLARSQAPDPTMIPLVSADARVFWVPALLVLVGCAVFAHVTDRDAGWARREAVRLSFQWIADQGRATAWIAPTLTLGAALLLVGRYQSWPVVLLTPVLAGSGVFVGMLARHYAFEADEQMRRVARMAMLASTHATILVLLSLVYGLRMRSLLSGPVVAVVVAVTVLACTDGLDARLRDRIVLSVVAGGVLGEAVWPLNYWNAPGWWGGVSLWALTAALAGVVAAHLEQRLTPSVIARLAGFAAVATAFVAIVADQPL